MVAQRKRFTFRWVVRRQQIVFDEMKLRQREIAQVHTGHGVVWSRVRDADKRTVFDDVVFHRCREIDEFGGVRRGRQQEKHNGMDFLFSKRFVFIRFFYCV
jgi:hypothetical protein